MVNSWFSSRKKTFGTDIIKPNYPSVEELWQSKLNELF